VSVFNTGEHIPEECMDSIWISFYKIDKARTRSHGGTGLGLSIVKAVQKAHGNECGCENVDGGVMFWFDVDLA
ncbi:MAG: ATP-binding protein, partial [Clostridia bacterium]|nr:ATP-binding protein [Clostridia bacterium]